jgi:hypothetical protein
MSRIKTVVDLEEQRRNMDMTPHPKQAFVEPESAVVIESKPKNTVMEIKGFKHTSAKEYIEKAITSSTVHRLGSIYSVESWPLRFFLGAFFLLSASYCMLQIVNTIKNFASFGVLTTTSYNYQIPAEFPGNTA